MSHAKGKNIVWHRPHVGRAERRASRGHHSAVLWFTGLSGAGKSTVANLVDWRLHDRGIASYVLDGDNIRHGLNENLGFSAADRHENIRRIGEVAKLFVDAGVFAVTAFISPYREDRDRVRHLLAADEFVEIYVDASLATCEERDPKGLYKKARAGEIKGFTGIDDPYEPPLAADLVLDANGRDPEQLADEVVAYLEARGFLPKR
jgi:adenylylsulfate kinase